MANLENPRVRRALGDPSLAFCTITEVMRRAGIAFPAAAEVSKLLRAQTSPEKLMERQSADDWQAVIRFEQKYPKLLERATMPGRTISLDKLGKEYNVVKSRISVMARLFETLDPEKTLENRIRKLYRLCLPLQREA
jgi:hypothetical protein